MLSISPYVPGEHDPLYIQLLLLYSAYSYGVYCLLEFIEESGGVSAVHLHVVELEGDRQGGPQPALAVAAPHHHRIAELVGVLVDDTVEFGDRHRRCAYHHRIIYEGALARRAGRLCQIRIVLAELFQIICIQDVARVDATFFVVHYHVDGKPIVLIQFPLLRQQIELVHPTGNFADAPAQEHIEFHIPATTYLRQSRHIERLRERHHRHG